MNANPRPVATVSELVKAIKGRLEPFFPDFWIKGEVSNFRGFHASGHLYFSLKDAEASIPIAMFGAGRRKLPFELKDGLEVICHGKVSVYPMKGYQVIADQLEPVGVGALQLAFEQLKTKLSQEGIFSDSLKKSIPTYPTHIFILTGETTAALQDVLTVLNRRAPHVPKILIPTPVQGADAAPKIVQGLRELQQSLSRLKASAPVLLVIRGGGSIEDLWCFNDESVVREIRACLIPVVTGIGHEIDFTLSDFAADYRAPTPSVAAEIATQGWWSAKELIDRAQGDLNQRLFWLIGQKKELVRQASQQLISPFEKLQDQAQRLDEVWEQLMRGAKLALERKTNLLGNSLVTLEALSPLKVLARGYSVLYDKGGHVVSNVSQLHIGETLRFKMKQGGGSATIDFLE